VLLTYITRLLMKYIATRVGSQHWLVLRTNQNIADQTLE